MRFKKMLKMLILSATFFKKSIIMLLVNLAQQQANFHTEAGLQYACLCSVFQARNGPEARGLLPRAARCPTGDLFPGEIITLVRRYKGSLVT